MSRISFEQPLSTNHVQLWPPPYVVGIADIARCVGMRPGTLYLWRLCWLRARGRV